MQVPTYAKYIKDILGNKRSLPTTEIVQLIEECSAAIPDPLLERRRKIQDAPQSHIQSGISISHMLCVIWEQASASYPR